MAWHPGGFVIAVQLLVAACVTRAPAETTAGDATEATGGATSSGATTAAPDPTSTTATASPGGTATTGAEACVLVVGPTDEPPEADPAGCFAVADEAGCAAKGDACMALFGVPAECTDSQWCLPAPDAKTFLGCRPFTVCKPFWRLVCVAADGGAHAFYTTSCTPMGFGPCEPAFESQDSGSPPACE